MFGWELPPYNSGGLGTASLGLTESLAADGVDIDFVVPRTFGPFPYTHMRIIGADQSGGDPWPEHQGGFAGYGNHQGMAADGTPVFASYAQTAEAQARWYARRGAAIAQANPSFDLVHAHDWIAYDAGVAARTVAARHGEQVPFVAHIHSTEWDRGGQTAETSAIAKIEQRGLQAADRVVAVSDYTKQIVHRQYNIPKAKISVVHNGIAAAPAIPPTDFDQVKRQFKIVLSLGRITASKGPEQFLKLAKLVTNRDPRVKFVMVGGGDLERQTIELAAQMGLSGKLLFSSFLRGEDVERAYQLADLFVMPSVSEPYGLVALEAMRAGTPTIISKQSGVSEVVKNGIALDYWDVDGMAKSVLYILHHPAYASRLGSRSREEALTQSWKQSAGRLEQIYAELTGGLASPRLLAA